MRTYSVIKEDALTDFIFKVNELLDRGWELHGNFIALPHVDREGSFWYFQSMVFDDV